MESKNRNPFTKVKETIGEYNVHPMASIWPIVIEDAMVDDIRDNGIRMPIILDEAGLVVDGRTRLTIHYKLMAEPDSDYKDRYKNLPVKRMDFEQCYFTVSRFVLASNNYRRHLPDGVRCLCVAESHKLADDKVTWDEQNPSEERERIMAEMFGPGIEAKERIKETQVKPGEKKNPHGANQHARMARHECDEPSKPRDTKAENRNSTRGKLAEEAGVSRRVADQAIRVVAKAPPVVRAAVEAQEITLAQASRLVDDKEAIKKIAAGEIKPAEAVPAKPKKGRQPGQPSAKKAEPKPRVVVREGDIEKIFKWLDAATVADVQRVFDKCNEILN